MIFGAVACVLSLKAEQVKIFEDTFDYEHTFWDGNYVTVGTTGWRSILHPKTASTIDAGITISNALTFIIPTGISATAEGADYTTPQLYLPVTGNFAAITKVYKPWESENWDNYGIFCSVPGPGINHIHGYTFPVLSRTALRLTRDGVSSMYQSYTGADQWLKLVRTGDLFALYTRNSDSGDWTLRVSDKTYQNTPSVLHVGPYAANYATDGLRASYDLFEIWQEFSAAISVSPDRVKKWLAYNEQAALTIMVANNGTKATSLSVSIDDQSWLYPAEELPTNILQGTVIPMRFTLDATGITEPVYLTNRITCINEGTTNPVCMVIMQVTVLGREANRQLQPSSHRTPLIISEIMYNPLPGNDGLNYEFVELYNTEPVAQDISGFRLDGEIRYRFPEGTIIGVREYLVVAADPAVIEQEYGLTALGPYAGNLDNAGGVVRMWNNRGAVLLEVEYSDEKPWPRSADGGGHSLVLTRPDYGEGTFQAWEASSERGGNPGLINAASNAACLRIFINEMLVNPSSGEVAFIELYNHSTSAIDLGNYYLSDSPDVIKYQFPSPTVISGGGHIVVTANDWGTNIYLNPDGEAIYVIDPQERCVVDAIEYEREETGTSQGRYPDGSAGLRALAATTPGSANSRALMRDVVINEIMYHPITEDDRDEYIELYNVGPAAKDMSGWRIEGGIRYTMPAGTSIPAEGYLVIGRDSARLITAYPALDSNNTVGNYTGRLSDRGETIMLEKPDGSNGYIMVDTVAYTDGSDWGRWADGGGSSLELTDPRSDNTLPGNWAGSEDTAESVWTDVCVTGRLDNGSGACDRMEMLLLDSGECLVDDIEISRVGESNNRVGNGDFESGSSGWMLLGNHIDSAIVNGAGTGGSRAMGIEASGDGDNLVNCLRTYLTSSFSSGQDSIIAFKARWLRGNRRLLLRLHGNYLEASGLLSVPATLGSPGERNSYWTENTGPAVSEVMHSPVLPEAYEDVSVTAMIDDPDDVGIVTLYYRKDPEAAYMTSGMNDTGTDGDLIAGDGIYSGMIPGQADGTLIAFYLDAEDGHATPVHTKFPTKAPVKECLVRFGDSVPEGELGCYLYWMTASQSNAWARELKLSNRMFDGTFVYGGFRAVYDAGIRMRGSAWIRLRFGNPFSFIAAYMIKVPKADRVMGGTSFNMDNLSQQDVWGRGILDPTYVRERLSYWVGEVLGVPTPGQRYVHLYLNGLRKGQIYVDTHYPNGDYLESWFPYDSNGNNFEADDWFEWEGGPETKMEASLQNFTTTGGEKKQARYRWCWEKKAQNAQDDDYAPLYELVDAMNAPSNYYDAVDAVVDWKEWTRGIAVRRSVADRDGYGYQRGKNAYIYRGERTKWKYLVWDLDLGMGIERDADHGLFMEIADPVLANKFFRYPTFRRAYLRAMYEAATKCFAPEHFDPKVEEYYYALRDNDVNAFDLGTFKSWVHSRSTFIISEVQKYDVPFEITSNGGEDIITPEGVITLEGTAPIPVDHIRVNGYAYQTEWPALTNWQIRIGLFTGRNELEFQGYDSWNGMLEGMTDTITVVYYLGSNVAPGAVVINEIMYNPAENNAEYIELYNPSALYPVALSNYRMDGVEVAFDEFSWLGPLEYGIVVEDGLGFKEAYNPELPILAQYDGRLANGGEYIRLYRVDPDVVTPVTSGEVAYEDETPWPAAADGTGPSLQCIDNTRDTRRVHNWTVSEQPLYTPGTENAVRASLPAYPALVINEILPDNQTGLTDGTGDYDAWLEIYSDEPGTISLSNYYLTDDLNNLTKWPFPSDSVISNAAFLVVWLDGETHQSSTSEPHAAFTAGSVSGIVALVYTVNGTPIILDYERYNDAEADTAYGCWPDGACVRQYTLPLPTPGASNRQAIPPLTIVINEWMADNNTFIADPADGDYEDWFELYNYGTGDVDLSGCELSDGGGLWRIPTGTVIGAGNYLLVWADNDPNQNVPGNDLHTDFKLSADGEGIELLYAGLPIDMIVFGPQRTDISEGRWMDAEPSRAIMDPPTPGAPNQVPEPGICAVLIGWLLLSMRKRQNVEERGPGGYMKHMTYFALICMALFACGMAWGGILLEEKFESWMPAGWTVQDNTGGGCQWTSTSWIGRPNYAGGDGNAAAADSDDAYSFNVDTELRTPVINLSSTPGAMLSFVSAYKDIDPAPGTDHADVDISADGGGTWTTMLSWNESHDPEGPGEEVFINLEPYVGSSTVVIRFRYVSGWDWWWQVDDVTVIETVPGMPDPPERFGARPLSETEILLTWMTNITGDAVMIATNMVPLFGTPTLAYSPGDQIEGGGGVVYVGGNTNLLLAGLTPNTVYYFQAWSTNSVTYSFPISTSARTFTGLISSYPYSESFETGLGQWSPVAGADIEWTRRTGATPSSSTGPQGAADGEWYIYTEASGYNNCTALLDAGFNFTALNHPRLSFMYHMYGGDIGTLTVDINDGVWHDGVYLISGQQQTSMADPWREATLDLTPYAGKTPVVIRFRGLTGNSYMSDCAVDLITVQEQLPNIYFDPERHTKKGNPDTVVAYPVILQNYTGGSNEFSLAYNSDGWGITGIVSFLLPPAGVVTTSVSVLIPEDALAGDRSTGIVMAVSADGVYTNQMKCVTHCSWYYTALEELLDTDPGWSTQGQWAFGVPKGQGDGWMFDPVSGHTGPNVYGYNLNGMYTDNMPAYYLRTTVINCTDMRNLVLEFWRWLSVESCCDHATLEISVNGSVWHEVWDGYGKGIYDTDWQQCRFDISAYADNQPTVFLRWGMGPTDGSVVYPGWNIDDISIGYYRTDIDNAYLIPTIPLELTCYEYTLPLTAGLYREGETGSSGPAQNIIAELGYGRAGTYPTTGWTWVPAVYTSSDATSDYYQAQSLITMAGDLAWCFRFRKGQTVWTYADGDGSANGFSPDECGSITATAPLIPGTVLKEQPLRYTDLNAVESVLVSNSVIGQNDIMIVDDLTFSAEGYVYGLAWYGGYPEQSHAGSENGFIIKIFGGNSMYPYRPGTLLREEFHKGYASEAPMEIMNGLYEYSLVLKTPFHIDAGSTYWFGVQMDIGTNAVIWYALLSDNAHYGYSAVVMHNSGLWTLDSDLGIAVHGVHTNYGVACGRVTAAHSGQPLDDVSVTISDSRLTWQAVTDTGGWYTVPMPNGIYSMSVAKEHYVSQAMKGVNLNEPSGSTRHDFALAGSLLACMPGTLNLQAYKNAVITNTVVLSNSGPLPIDVTIMLNDQGITAGGTIFSGTPKPGVAICGSDSDTRLQDIRSKVNRTGKLKSSTIIDVWNSTPSLSELSAYDAVLMYNYYGYNNSTEMGNLIHDYANAGGGVVAMVQEVGYSGMYGRWNTSDYILAVYNGLTIGYHPVLGTLYDPLHPVLAGVTSFDGGENAYLPYISNVRPGAALIAEWNTGNPLILVKDYPHTRRVDLGFYPVSSDASSLGWDPATDGDLLMANALVWAANIDPGWIRISTNRATLPPGENVPIEVVCDASGLDDYGTYGMQLFVKGTFVNTVEPLAILLNRLGDPIISVPLSVDFGEVEVDESASIPLKVSNNGYGILTGEVQNITEPFGVSGDPFYTVEPDAYTTLQVYFAPIEEGRYSNTIIFTGGGAADVLLVGTGIPEPGGIVLLVVVAGMAMKQKVRKMV